MRLNRAPNEPWNSDGRFLGKAPHKPMLLLCVLRGIRLGRISRPFVALNDALVNDFEFLQTRLGIEHSVRIELPFHHLQTETYADDPLWRLFPARELSNERAPSSLDGLKEICTGAEINIQFWEDIAGEDGWIAAVVSLISLNFDEALVRELVAFTNGR
jgi:predicted restriction endonuclease